eukprot:4566671-Amphidinium_carterae.1
MIKKLLSAVSYTCAVPGHCSSQEAVILETESQRRESPPKESANAYGESGPQKSEDRRALNSMPQNGCEGQASKQISMGPGVSIVLCGPIRIPNLYSQDNIAVIVRSILQPMLQLMC